MQTRVLLLLAMLLCAPSSASAAIIYGATAFRNLISFDSAAPAAILTSAPISGLGDPFESIVGMDFRPATGVLYALGNAPGSIYRLYTMDLNSGVATRVPGNADMNLSGTFWGFDFNPTVDRIRVVSDSGTNIRLNPNDGSLAGTDTNLSATGVAAVAYDRNDNDPGTATTLFGINFNTDQLVRIGGVDGSPSPNLGAVTNIGALGVDTLGFTSLDISDTGIAYAAMTIGNPIPSSLYTINLNTGAATLVGQIGDGSDGLMSMAVSPTAVPEPSSAACAACVLFLLGLRRRRQKS